MSDSAKLMLKIAYNALDDKKARDIEILDIHRITTIADYFVITTGTSTTHVKALADAAEEKLQEQGFSLGHKEGYGNGRWILLDYRDIVIHVFHDEDRKFYNLEKVWGDAQIISIDNI
jgi:ribosome-associated protein